MINKIVKFLSKKKEKSPVTKIMEAFNVIKDDMDAIDDETLRKFVTLATIIEVHGTAILRSDLSNTEIADQIHEHALIYLNKVMVR